MATNTQDRKNSKPVQPGPSRKPPTLLMKVMNPLMGRMLRRAKPGKIGEGLLLLSFTGRKSGKLYTTPVAYNTQPDGTIHVYTHRPWWKNMEGGAPVSIWLRGQQRQAQADATSDPGEVVAAVRAYGERNGAANIGRVGIVVDPNRPLDDAHLREATSGLHLIRIKL